MLRVKMLMCLLSFTLLLDCYEISTITPFHALATWVVKDNYVEMVHMDEIKLSKKIFIMQYNTIAKQNLNEKSATKLEENLSTELDKNTELNKNTGNNSEKDFAKNSVEDKNKDLGQKTDNETNKKTDEEKKENEPEKKEFILTFYTSLECENSSAGAVTCQNNPLRPGGVANNVIPLNTKIYLEGYGEVTVNDRGSQKYFGVDNRLDVFIEREPGESDPQYSRRVNNYGVQRVQGYIIK